MHTLHRNAFLRTMPGVVGAITAAGMLIGLLHAEETPLSVEKTPKRPPLKQLRYDEDFSFLRDPARRTDFWDPVKYIPLNASGDWYLTIGGEVRERYEWFHNTDFGTGPIGPFSFPPPPPLPPGAPVPPPPEFPFSPQDNNGYLLQRYMLHFDLHLGKHLRIFTQLKSNWETGRNGGPRPVDEDRFDLHQLFADIVFQLPFGLSQAASSTQSSAREPATGTSKADDASEIAGPTDRSPGHNTSTLILRGGRQELAYGSSRLISFREGPNVRQSFDTGRAIFETPGFRADAFYARPVETDPGVWDDQAQDWRELYGVYTVTELERLGFARLLPGAKGTLDLYYLGYGNERARFNEGNGNERRHSIGARLAGNWRNLDWNFEAVGQWGTFDKVGAPGGDIAAWTVASDTGYTFARLPFRPRLALKADIASGDDVLGDGNLNTFNALFPKGAYFGESAIIGPYNIMDLHPYLELKLSRDVLLTLEAIFFWRESLEDGMYNVPGTLVRPSNGSRARYIGTQLNAVLGWKVSDHLALEARYERFEAGPFIEDTGPSGNVDYVAVTFQYKF